MLVLRTCDSNMVSQNGFVWPESGYVECDDWQDDYNCGHGLHGLPWGVGGSHYLSTAKDAKWLVVEVDDNFVLHGKKNMTDKCKFQRGNVVFCGGRDEAIEYLLQNGAADKPVVYANKVGGDRATLTGGDGSTLIGGNRSILTGGHEATLVGGNRAILTGGDRSILTGGTRATLTGGNGAILIGGHGTTLTGGDRSTLIGGDGATLTGGDRSTLIGGEGATLTCGDRSILTGGDRSILTGGYWSTLTGGYGATLTGGQWSILTGGVGATLTGGHGSTLTGGEGATLTGGHKSTLIFKIWDNQYHRINVAYVGENGIESNIPYVFSDGEIKDANA